MLRLRKTPRFDALLDGAIEIDEHHHPELRREAVKRDEAHRRGNGDGVAEDIDEPYAADERERQCQQDDQRLPHAPESEIEQDEYYADRRRHHPHPPLSGPLCLFELTRPGYRIVGLEID